MEIKDLIVWLSENGFEFVASLLSIVFGLVIMIVQLKKYKLNSNQAKENNLKYRTENYQQKKGFEPTAQTFERVVKVYELDDKTNSLVVVGTKDLQELVQSSRDCGLDIILEKYGALPPQMLPEVSSKTDVPYDATDLRDDFEMLSDYHNGVEDMRSRYSMPDASPEELFAHISKLRSDNDKKIQEQLLKNKQKEITENEV